MIENIPNGMRAFEIRNRISVREDEAALLLSVGAKTLGEWRKSGDGPPCFLKGKFWFYPIRTLEEWAAAQVS